MTRSKTLLGAKKTSEESNGVEDSQKLWEQYVTEYGIGVTSSSPPPAETESSKQRKRGTKGRRDPLPILHSDPPSHSFSQADFRPLPSTAPPATNPVNTLPREGFIHAEPSVALPDAVAVAVTFAEPKPTAAVGQDRGPYLLNNNNINNKHQNSFCAASNPQKSIPNFDGDAIAPPSDATPALCTADETSGFAEKVCGPPRASLPHAPRKATMDISQQSPTQANDERDYENYYDRQSFVETSPISQNPPTENQTIRDDDSGAVNFGSLSHLIPDRDTQDDEIPSSIPDDAGPAIIRGAWRTRASSSQQQSSLQRPDGESPIPTAPLAPQTPAHQQNPFAGMNKLRDPALVGSQLFGQTQLSSAVKKFSPTSSRPSPIVCVQTSISPNIIDTSPLKNRYSVTSPPDLISSSPQVINIAPFAPDAREESPSNSGPPEDGTVPESPQYVPASARPGPEPLGTYENMVESQKRKLKRTQTQDHTSEDDSDDDMAAVMKRRRLAASKQEAAARQLTSISVRRTARVSVGVPSTTRKPARRNQARASRYQVQHAEDGSTASDNDVDEYTVADSQGQAAAQQSQLRPSSDLADPSASQKPVLVSSNDAVPDSARATQKSVPNGVIPGTESSGDSSRPKDLIPETSPTNTQSRLAARIRASSDEPLVVSKQPAELEEGPGTEASESNKVGEVAEPVAVTPKPPSLPQPSRRSNRKSRPTLKAQSLRSASRSAESLEPVVAQEVVSEGEVGGSKEATASTEQPAGPEAIARPSASSDVDSVEQNAPLPSSPPVLKPLVDVNNDQVHSGLQSQERPARKSPSTPNGPESPVAPEPPNSTSTLSDLTTTPIPSDKASPETQESVELPPLSPDKSKRGRRPTKSLPRLATESRIKKPESRRQVRRTAMPESASTDELTRSPSVTGFENSIIHPPRTTARGSRLSMLSHTSKDFGSEAKIFVGMAFAISFQSKKDGERTDEYDQRVKQTRDVEKMIFQSGGLLLENGFDELFEPNALRSTATTHPTSECKENLLTLTPSAHALGFTALIADGHSRKVKYMQALALGLPCISDRWVTTCVAKGSVVDWLPYLLCAGQSTFLRNAIRSRYLAPYPATEARFVDIVQRRPKMLDGSQILLVMKKSRAEEKMMPYVFLAQVLGATLSRAYSLDEAKEMLRHAELLNDPFDWVYVDEHTGTEEGLFSSAATAPKPSRKRKRAAAAVVADEAPPPKRIRTLSNELVIQSLILGRMIEEGELEG